MTDQTSIKEKKSIYSIMSGDNEDEFFSYYPPTILEDRINVKEPFKKGIISEEILNQRVEEYYISLINGKDSISLFLITGILIKEYDVNDINWINTTEDTAKSIIKDKIILKYQQVMPSLMDKLKSLEIKVKQNTLKRQENTLIDL